MSDARKLAETVLACNNETKGYSALWWAWTAATLAGEVIRLDALSLARTPTEAEIAEAVMQGVNAWAQSTRDAAGEPIPASEPSGYVVRACFEGDANG